MPVTQRSVEHIDVLKMKIIDTYAFVAKISSHISVFRGVSVLIETFALFAVVVIDSNSLLSLKDGKSTQLDGRRSHCCGTELD